MQRPGVVHQRGALSQGRGDADVVPPALRRPAGRAAAELRPGTVVECPIRLNLGFPRHAKVEHVRLLAPVHVLANELVPQRLHRILRVVRPRPSSRPRRTSLFAVFSNAKLRTQPLRQSPQRRRRRRYVFEPSPVLAIRRFDERLPRARRVRRRQFGREEHLGRSVRRRGVLQDRERGQKSVIFAQALAVGVHGLIRRSGARHERGELAELRVRSQLAFDHGPHGVDVLVHRGHHRRGQTQGHVEAFFAIREVSDASDVGGVLVVTRREPKDVLTQVVRDAIGYRRGGDEELGGGEHIVRVRDPVVVVVVRGRRGVAGSRHDELRIPPALRVHESHDRRMRGLGRAAAPERRAGGRVGEPRRRVDIARSVVAIGRAPESGQHPARRLAGRYPDTRLRHVSEDVF